MKFRKLIGDPELENNGAWCDMDPDDPVPAKVLIARANNDKFRSVLAKLLEPFIPLIRAGKMDEKLRADLGIQATAEAICLAWVGMEDDDGTILEPSPENRLMLLRESSEFRDWVWARASDSETYQRRAIEAASGN